MWIPIGRLVDNLQRGRSPGGPRRRRSRTTGPKATAQPSRAWSTRLQARGGPEFALCSAALARPIDERSCRPCWGTLMLGADSLTRLEPESAGDDTLHLRRGLGVPVPRRSGLGHGRRHPGVPRTDATAPALKEVSPSSHTHTASCRAVHHRETTRDRPEAKSYPRGSSRPSTIAGPWSERQFDLPNDYLDTYLAKLKGTKPSERQVWPRSRPRPIAVVLVVATEDVAQA